MRHLIGVLGVKNDTFLKTRNPDTGLFIEWYRKWPQNSQKNIRFWLLSVQKLRKKSLSRKNRQNWCFFRWIFVFCHFLSLYLHSSPPINFYWLNEVVVVVVVVTAVIVVAVVVWKKVRDGGEWQIILIGRRL